MILGIPAIDCACDYLPVFEWLEDLEMYQQFINEMPKLAYYKPSIENAFMMYNVVKKIKLLFADVDEFIQKDIKKMININDGRLISRVINKFNEKDGFGDGLDRPWVLLPLAVTKRRAVPFGIGRCGFPLFIHTNSELLSPHKR